MKENQEFNIGEGEIKEFTHFLEEFS